MTLSVIIVNHNVKYFLEQCLFSVQAALKNIAGEIIVVDNASTDESTDYLRSKFSSVKFFCNKINMGFGAACNLGFKQASGEFVLFLNPDTIIPEDCFEKCISFLNPQQDAGATGIKMLDGSGKFLKESKRSFPSAAASFYKLFGLSALFPRSRVFAKYYCGHLDENENHEVDVLAGAFMFFKRSVFEKISGFDEDFFMYGEDIDLSYRVQQAGYKNFYFSESEIIHFKGESTRKEKLDYIKQFYGAMIVFVNKHYKGMGAGLFRFIIHAGIFIRAAWSLAGSLIKKISSFITQDKTKSINPAHTAIACSPEEYDPIFLQMKEAGLEKFVTGRIAVDNTTTGSIAHIQDIITPAKTVSFNEIIFCSGVLSCKKIIELIKQLPENIQPGIHAAGSGSVISSYSKDRPGHITVL